MTVFTIGYEGLDIASFLSLLAQHGIGTVVDIRQLPLSRKRGFSKKALAGRLNGAGFEYIHMASLGCPKPVRDREADFTLCHRSLVANVLQDSYEAEVHHIPAA
jgi:uncharacterized protein (DUF488 family)